VAVESPEINQAEDAILSILKEADAPMQPIRVIEVLKQDKGISEYSSRAAIWYLIGRHQIELTSRRLLRYPVTR
jgi:hypothetical protein